MNIVEICKYLKISPLVRKTGTEQVSSGKPIARILTENFDSALQNLPGGREGERLHASVTSAYLSSQKELETHPDLTHLITTAHELGGVLKEIPLNEIQPLLIHLIDKDPTQKSVIASIFDMTFFDKLSVGLAATVTGAFAAAASAYVVYRLSEKFMKRVLQAPPETALDQLIVNQEGLCAVLGQLSEFELCEALMVLRHVKCYQTIMDGYQPQKSSVKFTLMGFDLTPELFLSFAQNTFKGAQLNKLKRLLQDDTADDTLTRHLQNSRLLNNTEQQVIRLLSTKEEKLRYTLAIISCLELIHTLDQVTVFTKKQASWENQEEAYQKIYLLFDCVSAFHTKLMRMLTDEENEALNKILRQYLPIHFYSHLQNALIKTVDAKMSGAFSTGRISYYNCGAIEQSVKDQEVKDKLDLCLPIMEKLLAINDEKTPSGGNKSASAAMIEDDSSDDEEQDYYDARPGTLPPSEPVSPPPTNEELDDIDYVLVESKLGAKRLNSEQLKALTQDLKACLKDNCIRITGKLGEYHKSREAIRKKVSFLTRCYVTLDKLVFDTEENTKKNRAILASVCVQVSLLSTIETHHFSLVTEFSSETLDKLASTKTKGALSSKSIKEILDKYELAVFSDEKTLFQVIRCFNDAIWPVACSALLRLDKFLYDAHVDVHTQERAEEERSASTSSFSFFNLDLRMPTLAMRIPTLNDISSITERVSSTVSWALSGFFAIKQDVSSAEAATEETKESCDLS